jgi:hypothetical protein
LSTYFDDLIKIANDVNQKINFSLNKDNIKEQHDKMLLENLDKMKAKSIHVDDKFLVLEKYLPKEFKIIKEIYNKIKFLITHCKTILLNQENLKIELTPSTKELQEVIISAGKYKNLITGNNIKSSMIIAGFQNRSLGAEMGTVLKYNKEKKGLLTNLHFNVVANKFDTIKFRVNLYEIENGIPNESMLSEPIYFYGTPTNGAITINVSERRIHLKKDILK